MTIEEVQHLCLNRQIPFFTYRKTNSSHIIMGVQKQPVVEFPADISCCNGFLIAPFDKNSHKIFIHADILFKDELKDDYAVQQLAGENNTSEKEQHDITSISEEIYLKQADFLIGKLKSNELKKIVLSRVIKKEGIPLNDAPDIFSRLEKKYKHAFVSFFFLPGKGCWIGATPELLLRIENGKLATMSLAGTKKSDDTAWTKKETDEQLMVSDYIENTLKESGVRNIQKSETDTLKAGTVFHLKTDFTADIALSSASIERVLNALHPTPAVCGIPVESAFSYIKNTELHDRQFYSGYIGPVNCEETNGLELFVNVRTMQLINNNAYIYAGGGLTALSSAAAEWNETCMKAETLTSIL